MKIDWKRSASHWYFFLAATAISNFVLSWGVSIHCKPSPQERIRYMVFTYGVEAQKLVEFTSNKIPGIREVKIEYSNPVQEKDAQRLFTYVYETVDFYIVPTSWMSMASGYSCHFDENSIHQAVPSSSNFELYSFEGSFSGIKIYDHQTKQGAAKSYFTYASKDAPEEDFYLCFPASSCHTGSLGHQSLSEGLLIAEELLKL
ncbi:MAG: hypothetical protein MJ239_04090 [Bacilli bacterium]|nr:hypothetical protein [Bacilli bacterium]